MTRFEEKPNVRVATAVIVATVALTLWWIQRPMMESVFGPIADSVGFERTLLAAAAVVAVTNVAVNVTMQASDPRVHIINHTGVLPNVGAGATCDTPIHTSIVLYPEPRASAPGAASSR